MNWGGTNIQSITLIIYSIYVIDIGLFRLSIYACLSFGILCLRRNWFISSRLSHLWTQSYLYCFFITLLMFTASEVMSPLSLMILVICVLSFFLVIQARGSLILLIFQTTSFGFYSSSPLVLFSILFISALIFITSANFGFNLLL